MEIILKAFRSKKDGYYFKFEYFNNGCDGEYEANISEIDMIAGDLPSLFGNTRMLFGNTRNMLPYPFRDHKKDEIEEVEFIVRINENKNEVVINRDPDIMSFIKNKGRYAICEVGLKE